MRYSNIFGAFALTMVSAVSSSAWSGPFSGYEGAWSGAGSIATTNGSEPIRCRAVYAVGSAGATMQQNLICASDSYRFEVTSHVTAAANQLSGSWSESTRGASGSLTGRIADGHFRANVAGAGFTAAISLESRRDRQSVTITPQGTDVQRVSMILQRR